MKKRVFSCLLALALAAGLLPVLGGTARAEKPVIDTITITNTSFETPVIGSYAVRPTFTVSPEPVRANVGSCQWLPVETNWEYLDTRVVTPGQYRFQYSLVVDSAKATLADQVTVIIDGKSTKVTPDPKPDSMGNVYLTAYSQPCTAVTQPQIPGSVTLNPDSNPLKGGTTLGFTLSGGAEKLSPDILSYSWRHRKPGSDMTFVYNDADKSTVVLDSNYIGYEVSLMVTAEGYSGFLTTDWRLVEEGASYTVTVTDGAASKTTAKGGEKVYVTAAQKEDYAFDHWVVVSGNVDMTGKGASASFYMPDGDVKLKAEYRYSGDFITEAYVTLPLPAAGERPQGAKADTEGYRVTSTVWTDLRTNTDLSPTDVFEEGVSYLAQIIVASNGLPMSSGAVGYVNGSGKNVSVFPMGMALCKLTVSLTAAPGRANPFADVAAGDYWYSPVLWAFYHSPQITVGVDAAHFGPKQTVTRGQCVTFLWRAEGCPEPSAAKNPFADVDPSDYWYRAILWAVENGITVGTDAAHFSPNKTLSTHHIVTFLYRALNPGQGGASGGWDGAAESWARQNDPGKANLPFGVNIAVSDDTPCPRGDVVTFLFEALAG